MSATALLTSTTHPAPPVRHLSLPGAAAPITPIHHATRSIDAGLPARLNRYLGGLCSPTIQMIQLTNGRRVRTDLVRLNPTVDAYSLDLDGIAPTPVSHYRPSRQSDTGTRPADPALARILAGSFPLVPLGELSRRVRAEGYPLVEADLREHEAIAATQAALWHFTNGVDLDVRPRSTPVRLSAGSSDGTRTDLAPSAPTWAGSVSAARPIYVDVTFDGRPQLGSYRAGLVTTGGHSPLTLGLERSSDGLTWQPVTGSERSVAPTPGSGAQHTDVDVILGLGATLADGAGQGFRAYRLVLATTSAEPVPVGLESLSFTLTATPTYVNPEGVVHLYRYLLETVAGPAADGCLPPAPVRLVHAGSGTVPPPAPSTVGPFLLTGLGPTQQVSFEPSDDLTTTVVDVWGQPLTGSISASEPFFVRLEELPALTNRLVVHAAQPLDCAPLVLVGSRAHDGRAEFTPLLHGARAVQQDSYTFRLQSLLEAHGPSPISGQRAVRTTRGA